MEQLTGKQWLAGLAAAGITGGATAASAAVVDPSHFNLASQEGLVALGQIFIAGAVIGALAYLKQSPVPPSWDRIERRKLPPRSE